MIENTEKTLPIVTTPPATETVQRSLLDQTRLARLISLALHPFLVSPLSIILILYLDRGNLVEALGWAGLCAAFVVGPALLYLRQELKAKHFTDADVSVQEHRYGFYVLGGVCMAACYGVLLLLDAPAVLVAGFTAALCALIVATITNRLWSKVSIHAGAMAGVTAAAIFYSLPLAIILGMGTLAVSWARLVTHRHTAIQTVLGWVIAVACVAVVFRSMAS